MSFTGMVIEMLKEKSTLTANESTEGKTMKKLVYYSNFDVLVQVRYSYQENALLFTSQRKLSEKERKNIENSLKKNLAVETNREQIASASLFYLGKNFTLKGKLNQLDSIRPTQYEKKRMRVVNKTAKFSPSNQASAPIHL